jgi:hypothetical protein
MRMANARLPSAWIAAAVSPTDPGNFSVDRSLRAHTTTFAPSLANLKAMALPIPRELPVTTATRSEWKDGK